MTENTSKLIVVRTDNQDYYADVINKYETDLSLMCITGYDNIKEQLPHLIEESFILMTSNGKYDFIKPFIIIALSNESLKQLLENFNCVMFPFDDELEDFDKLMKNVGFINK